MNSKVIKLNKIQKIAYYLAQEKRNLLVIGSGGTGKSLLIRQVDKVLSNTACLSFTGNASLNIEGQTIHSFFGLSVDCVDDDDKIRQLAKKQKQKFQALKTVIIDELSMVRLDMFTSMDKILRLARNSPVPFGGVRIIMFADFCQLSPVPLINSFEREPFVFESPLWRKLNVNEISLMDPERTKDSDYNRIIEEIRVGQMLSANIEDLNDLISENKKEKGCTVLTATNKRAELINQRELESIDGKTIVSHASMSPGFSTSTLPNDKDLVMKLGMRLMFLVNASGYKNGQTGTLVDISKNGKEVTIQKDAGGLIKVKRHKWLKFEYKTKKSSDKKLKIHKEVVGHFTQYPFRVCYAMTIHKSQGQTLGKMHLDLTDELFGSGQAYVALSRVRKREDISISRPLSIDDVKFCPVAVRKTIQIEMSTNAKTNGYSIKYKDKSDVIREEQNNKERTPTEVIRESVYNCAIKAETISELKIELEKSGVVCDITHKNDIAKGIHLSYGGKTFPFSKVMGFGLIRLSDEYNIDLDVKEEKKEIKKENKDCNYLLNQIFI